VGATFFLLADTGLLVTAYWGLTDPAESQVVREARAAVAGQQDLHAHVIDLSQLQGTVVSARAEADVFRSLATRYAGTFGPLPTAVVAPAPHVFGLARIFETVGGLQTPPLPIRVVRSWGEAETFLGLDLQAAAAEIERRRQAEP
jgi:hypothetical protein